MKPVTREEFEVLKRAVAVLEVIVSGRTTLPDAAQDIETGEKLEAFHKALEGRVYEHDAGGEG